MTTITLPRQSRLDQSLKFACVLTVTCAVAVAGMVVPARADIYKWRDATGVIYYSNHPPADLTSLLDIIPGQSAAADSGSEPKAFYLSTPGGPTDDSFTIPPDVLQELFETQVRTTATAPPPLGDAPDVTTFTLRLAEVERIVHQEVETRRQWQQHYADAQAVTATLEQQNRTLNTALAAMETEIATLRETFATAETEVTALKHRLQPGQYVMLENTVTGIREQVQALSVELESLNPPELSAQVASLAHDLRAVRIRQNYEYALDLRLNSLEERLRRMTDTQSAPFQAVETLTRLEERGETLTSISASHDRRLEHQQMQIAALQAELELVKTARTPVDTQATPRDAESHPLPAGVIETTPFMDAAPAGGIRIVSRMERRRTSWLVRAAIRLATPRPQTEE